MESQLKIKLVTRYKSKDIFNPDTLIHEEREDGTMVRKWENTQGEIIGEYKLDGTMKLEEMTDDIISCFKMTGCPYFEVSRGTIDTYYYKNDSPESEIFPIIYETKLPFVKEVRRYDTGTVCTGVVEMVPKNYYELFSIIGLKKMSHRDPLIKIRKDGREYTVYQYPDSVWLHLEIKEDIIYFGYSR